MEMEKGGVGGGRPIAMPMFVNTNVGTRLVIATTPSDTVADIRGKIRNGHFFCFPHFGEIDVGALKVKHESLYYHLPDSIFVETAFFGSNETRYLLAEVSGSDLCNEEKGSRPNMENGRSDLCNEEKGSRLNMENGRSDLSNEEKGSRPKMENGSLLNKGGSCQLQFYNEKSPNNGECTDSDLLKDEKAGIFEEFGKDSRTPGNGVKALLSSGKGKICKKRKGLHDPDQASPGHDLSQRKETNEKEQTTKEVDIIVECSSEQALKNNKMDESCPLGQISGSDKVSALNYMKDNSIIDATTTTENLCQQQSFIGNMLNSRTDGDNEHVTEKELGMGRKHEMNSDEGFLNEAGKESDGLQGKSDDAWHCDTEKKSKTKRKRASKNSLVNSAPQINNHCHIQEYVYKKAEECDMKKKLKRKKSFSPVLGDGDREHSTEDVNDEPQITKHSHSLECEDRKTEDVRGASVLSIEKVQTGYVIIDGSVNYLDVAAHVESNQPFSILGKIKNISSRIDLSMEDGQDRIITEKAGKKDLVVNSGKIECDERKQNARNKKRRNVSSENERVTHLYMQHSSKDAPRDLENISETKGTTPKTNNENCNDDKTVKSVKKNPSKHSQERTVNIENGVIDDVAAGGQGTSVVLDETMQRRNTESGPAKDLGVSTNTESYQQLDSREKKKKKRSRNDLSRVNAQEQISTDQVLENDMAVNSGKGKGVESSPNVGNEKIRDIQGKNGELMHLDMHHSKFKGARDLEHIAELVGTTPVVNNENCNDKVVKSSNYSSKISQERTIRIEKIRDEEVGKGGQFLQNVRYDKRKKKDRLKSKNSAICDSYNSKRTLNGEQDNNTDVKKHKYVEQNIGQGRKRYSEVGCSVEQIDSAVRNCGVDRSNIHHSAEQKEDIGGGRLLSVKNKNQKSIQIEKLVTNVLSDTRKNPKEHQRGANNPEAPQPQTERFSPKRNVDSSGHPLKRTGSSSTAVTTQSSEQKQEDDSQKQTSIFVANDICVDSSSPQEQHSIDGMSKKLEFSGKTNDGFCLNREASKNFIGQKREKSLKKPNDDKHSKKDHISLFRSVSEESTEEENENDSYTVSSSSKRFSTDSLDLYYSDAGSREKISKSQSIKSLADLEPSTNGTLLSTHAGKKKDNGGDGSIHSKFVHLLSKKTSLGELFKIARSQKMIESEKFDGEFIADDSPSVDMVLETQDSQIDPVLSAPNTKELQTSPIISDEQRRMVKF